MKLQDVAIAIIVLTICVCMLASFLLPALGYPIDEAARTFVFGLFAAMAATTTTWLTATRIAKAEGEASALRGTLGTLGIREVKVEE